MKKRTGYWICAWIAVIMLMVVCGTIKAYAVPANYKMTEQTKKIRVYQKGYLKVTADRPVNYMLSDKKDGNTKNFQSKYGTEAYFAVTPGIYYLRCTSTYKFTLKYSRKRAPAGYRRNTSMSKAQLLKEGKMKIALAYAKDKRTNEVRYYKLIPERDGRIIFTGGVIYDKEGNLVPGITSSIFPIIYANKTAKKPKKVTWYEGFPGVYPYLRSSTLEPLKAGQTYYIKVDIGHESGSLTGPNSAKKVSVNCAVPVIWEFQDKNEVIAYKK